MNHGPPFHAAKQVLCDFRDQFIADMNVNTVVWELLYKDIIPRGIQEKISRTDEPKQCNQILHNCLQRTCTKEDLMEVCDIIVTVKGHPKMRQLGETMKKRLCTGTGVVCLCMEWRTLSPPHLTQPPALHPVVHLIQPCPPHPTYLLHSTRSSSLLCPLYRHF